jgi:DHA2 family multidrug resistance protein
VGLFAILLSPIVGKNVQKFDPRKLATFSFVMFSVVLWMRSQFSTQADFMTIMLPTIIQGIAVAFFFIPLSTLTLNGHISASAFNLALATVVDTRTGIIIDNWGLGGVV